MTKKLFNIFLFLIASLLIYSTICLAGQFEVTRVYDGDTVNAEGSGIEIKVRLVGIDAPETSRKKREMGQPYSQQSKKYLTALILNRTVDIKGYGLDGYNRVLGVIFLNGKNINLEMVRQGLAEVYQGKPPRGLDIGPYRTAEREARAAKRGMWSLGNKYISPKDWRRINKENR
jgi:endonuclease YncB( thermonuclease family)